MNSREKQFQSGLKVLVQHGAFKILAQQVVNGMG
jgi:hypothetical protein